MTFERIRNLREQADETERALADFLFIGQGIYSDYESGKINIPVEVLAKIADHYHTSVDYLINRTDIREPYPEGLEAK